MSSKAIAFALTKTIFIQMLFFRYIFFGDLSLLSFLVTSFYTGDVMLLGNEMVVISVMDTHNKNHKLFH